MNLSEHKRDHRSQCALCPNPMPAEDACIHGRWLCVSCCRFECWEIAT